MAITRQLAGMGAGASPNASTTRFASFIGGTLINLGTTGETQVQTQIRSGGTYSQMYARNIQAATAAATLHLNVNTATNGNSVLTIQATGEYTDETHTDAVTSSNKVSVAVTSGATTQVKLTLLGASFSATSNTVQRIGMWTSGNTQNAATTHYYSFVGTDASNNTTEANAQYKIRTGGTIQNLQISITANAHTTNGSITLNIGGVAGNLTAVLTNGGAGIFEDTTHTDTVTATNLLSLDILTGATVGSMTYRISSVELSTTDSSWVFAGGTMSGITQAAGLTNYLALTGDGVAATSEGNVNFLTDNTFTASFLSIRVITNTDVLDSTFNLRKNTGSANMTAAITALTTGYFEDTTNTDSLVSTDEINYQLITPSVSTSIIYTLLSCVMKIDSQVTPTNNSTTQFLMLLGLGN